jgi:hypothetical protein
VGVVVSPVTGACESATDESLTYVMVAPVCFASTIIVCASPCTKRLPQDGQSMSAGGESSTSSIGVSQLGQRTCMVPRLSHITTRKSRNFAGGAVEWGGIRRLGVTRRVHGWAVENVFTCISELTGACSEFFVGGGSPRGQGGAKIFAHPFLEFFHRNSGETRTDSGGCPGGE